MSNLKIATIVGARPQFVKASSVSRVLFRLHIDEILIHTGQHYDLSMSEVFFNELGIKEPDYNLGIGSGSHGQQTGRMLTVIENVLLKEQPGAVIVYGDTNSTLAGSIAAAKLHIPVVHVEAGLRSFNRKMPEEVNRVLTDHASDLLMAPTQLAVDNLKHEGIASEKVHLVGDVMYDVALYYAEKAEKESTILEHLNLQANRFVLATVHRAENTDCPQRLATIVESFLEISRDVPVVFPLHPRTRKAFEVNNICIPSSDSFQMIEPVGYLDMIMLEKNACLIATDSGGVQKEAFFYQVPCVTLRDETEWQELVELGWNTLIPVNDSSLEIAKTMLSRIDTSGISDNYPYGNGKAAKKIVEILSNVFQ